MNKIKRMLLKLFSTRELTDELVKRGGITAHYVDPYIKYQIKVDNATVKNDIGPCIIIENID